MLNFKALIGFMLFLGGLTVLSGCALIALLQFNPPMTAFFVWLGLLIATLVGWGLLMTIPWTQRR